MSPLGKWTHFISVSACGENLELKSQNLNIIGELLANIEIILTLWLERGRGGYYIWLSLKGNAFHDKQFLQR